jgi:hypothetical protein
LSAEEPNDWIRDGAVYARSAGGEATDTRYPPSIPALYDESISSLVPHGTYPALERDDVVSTGSIFSLSDRRIAPRSWDVEAVNSGP